jgi:carbamoyltransferase
LTRDTWTLGLNHGSHDAAAALARNGRVEVVVEQERLSRRKRAVEEAPTDAIASCLSFAGIELRDVRRVILGSDHDGLARFFGLSREGRNQVLPYDQPDRLFPDTLRQGHPLPTIVPVAHHLAHAASAYWPSGFTDAAVMVLDAMGESSSGMLGYAQPSGIEILRQLPIEGSLGFFYEAASLYSGLTRNDAGKFMGLASYGVPTMDVPLRFKLGVPEWAGIRESRLRGRAVIDERMADLLEEFERTCFPFAAGLAQEIMAYKDFAASVQRSLELVVLDLASEAKKLTNSKALVLAGGVALNCAANGRIASSGLFERIYVQPASHDAGVAIGASLLGAQDLAVLPARSHEMSVFLGPDESETQIRESVTRSDFSFVELTPSGLASEVARRLSQGAVVAWHQGRAENGPRALGGRSLLGDPRTRRSLLRLNSIKEREMWRPLAPSILAEHFSDYFIGIPSKHMLLAATVRERKRSLIPAVVHVDGSARPQVVTAQEQPLYRSMIEQFSRYTGIPLVVNTSLNLKDQPMSNTSQDTISLLKRSAVDCAAIGNFLVTRAGS